jgi:hypothetical protein
MYWKAALTNLAPEERARQIAIQDVLRECRLLLCGPNQQWLRHYGQLDFLARAAKLSLKRIERDIGKTVRTIGRHGPRYSVEYGDQYGDLPGNHDAVILIECDDYPLAGPPAVRARCAARGTVLFQIDEQGALRIDGRLPTLPTLPDWRPSELIGEDYHAF